MNIPTHLIYPHPLPPTQNIPPSFEKAYCFRNSNETHVVALNHKELITKSFDSNKDMSNIRILCIILERLDSQRFLIDKKILFQECPKSNLVRFSLVVLLTLF